jgi:hypothetical protein
VLEKCFRPLLYLYLERRNALNTTQFGFHHGYTAEQAVAYLSSVVNQAVDEGYRVSAIFTDIIYSYRVFKLIQSVHQVFLLHVQFHKILFLDRYYS